MCGKGHALQDMLCADVKAMDLLSKASLPTTPATVLESITELLLLNQKLMMPLGARAAQSAAHYRPDAVRKKMPRAA
jgi:hypothetical protein